MPGSLPTCQRRLKGPYQQYYKPNQTTTAVQQLPPASKTNQRNGMLLNLHQSILISHTTVVTVTAARSLVTMSKHVWRRVKPSMISTIEFNPAWTTSLTADVYSTVKAQVKDLYYTRGNLYPNYIIRHMLTKYTDHPPPICRWGVRMSLKGLDIRKSVSLGLASCMIAVPCITIIFCCLLFMCYHWISLRIYSCISGWVWWVASQLNFSMSVRLLVSSLRSGFLIWQLLTTQPHILALLQ